MSAYHWTWLRKEYEASGPSFRQLAAAHLKKFKVKVTVSVLADRAKRDGWIKPDKKRDDAPNLALVHGGEQKPDTFARGRETAVFVVQRHKDKCARLHAQLDKILDWTDDVFNIVDESKRLQKLLRDDKAPAKEKAEEARSTMRVLGVLRENLTSATQTLALLARLEREAFGIVDGRLPDEALDVVLQITDLDKQAILAGANVLEARASSGD